MKSVSFAISLLFFMLLPTVKSAAAQPSLLLVNGIGQKEYRVDPAAIDMLEKKWGTDIVPAHASFNSLSADLLEKFNVVILCYPPWEGAQSQERLLEQHIPALLNYVRSGGGLLIFADEMYRSYRNLNRLMMKIGLEVFPEGIVDRATLLQQPSFYRYYVAGTGNLDFSHPVLNGVKHIFYPIGNSPDNRELHHSGTLTFKADQNWNIIGRGNKSAKSFHYLPGNATQPGSYSEAPPLLAERKLGKGTIIFFSTRSRDYLHESYHPVFEQMCLKNGEGELFISNVLQYLMRPSLQQGFPGGYVPPAAGRNADVLTAAEMAALDPNEQLAKIMKRSPKTFEKTLPTQPTGQVLPVYKGIVGATIGLHDQMSPEMMRDAIQAFAEAARTAGVDFIAFAENMQTCNQATYLKFAAACQQISSASFTAIPGLLVADVFGDRRIVLAPPEWPQRNWLAKNAQNIAANHSHAYFGWDWAPYFLVGLKQAKFRPRDARFYTGIAISETEKDSRAVLSNHEAFRDVQHRDYNLIPIHYAPISNPRETNHQKIFTFVRVGNTGEIVSRMKYKYYAERPVFVSSGPELEIWSIENGRGGLRNERWNISLKIRSPKPLKSVTVYDQDKIWFRALPNATEFSTVLSGYHDRQRTFSIIAEDHNGGILHGPSLYTNDFRHQLTQCTDLQNTIAVVHGVSRKGRLCSYGGIGDTDNCWDRYTIRNCYPDQEMRPRTGIELGYKGWKLSSSPKWNNQMLAGTPAFTFGSGDLQVATTPHDRKFANVPGGYFPAPDDNFSVDVEHRNWTSLIYGINVHGVRQTIRIQKKGALISHKAGHLLHCFVVDFPEGSFEQITVFAPDGKKEKISRRSNITQEFIIRQGGALSMSPEIWGACGFIPLDGDYLVIVEKKRALFRKIFSDRNELHAGNTIKTDVLFMNGPFNSLDSEPFEPIRTGLGIAGVPQYRLDLVRGKKLSDRYELVIMPENGVAEFKIDRRALTAELPVMISGLNQNWDAAVFDKKRRTLDRIGIWNGAGCFQIYPQKSQQDLAAGNLLVCDRPEIRLSLLHSSAENTQIVIHNPLSEKVTTTVRPGVAAVFLNWPGATLELAPASTAIINIGEKK